MRKSISQIVGELDQLQMQGVALTYRQKQQIARNENVIKGKMSVQDAYMENVSRRTQPVFETVPEQNNALVKLKSGGSLPKMQDAGALMVQTDPVDEPTPEIVVDPVKPSTEDYRNSIQSNYKNVLATNYKTPYIKGVTEGGMNCINGVCSLIKKAGAKEFTRGTYTGNATFNDNLENEGYYTIDPTKEAFEIGDIVQYSRRKGHWKSRFGGKTTPKSEDELYPNHAKIITDKYVDEEGETRYVVAHNFGEEKLTSKNYSESELLSHTKGYQDFQGLLVQRYGPDVVAKSIEERKAKEKILQGQNEFAKEYNVPVTNISFSKPMQTVEGETYNKRVNKDLSQIYTQNYDKLAKMSDVPKSTFDQMLALQAGIQHMESGKGGLRAAAKSVITTATPFLLDEARKVMSDPDAETWVDVYWKDNAENVKDKFKTKQEFKNHLNRDNKLSAAAAEWAYFNSPRSKGAFQQKELSDRGRFLNLDPNLESYEDQAIASLALMIDNYHKVKKQYPEATEEELLDLSTLMHNAPSKALTPEFYRYFVKNKDVDYVKNVKQFVPTINIDQAQTRELPQEEIDAMKGFIDGLSDAGPQMRYGGSLPDLPKYQNAGVPTRLDSINLLQNNQILDDLIAKGTKDVKFLETSSSSQADDMYNSQLLTREGWTEDAQGLVDALNYEKRGDPSTSPPTREGNLVGAKDWWGGGGDDDDFPTTYRHRFIDPQGQAELTALPRDGSHEVNSRNVHIYTYDDLAITPFDMLTPEQKKMRVEKYGSKGVPDSYIKNQTSPTPTTSTRFPPPGNWWNKIDPMEQVPVKRPGQLQANPLQEDRLTPTAIAPSIEFPETTRYTAAGYPMIDTKARREGRVGSTVVPRGDFNKGDNKGRVEIFQNGGLLKYQDGTPTAADSARVYKSYLDFKSAVESSPYEYRQMYEGEKSRVSGGERIDAIVNTALPVQEIDSRIKPKSITPFISDRKEFLAGHPDFKLSENIANTFKGKIGKYLPSGHRDAVMLHDYSNLAPSIRTNNLSERDFPTPDQINNMSSRPSPTLTPTLTPPPTKTLNNIEEISGKVVNKDTGESWTKEEWEALKGKGAFGKARQKARMQYGGSLPKYQVGTPETEPIKEKSFGDYWKDFEKSKAGKFVDAKGLRQEKDFFLGQLGYGDTAEEGRRFALDAAAMVNPAPDLINAYDHAQQGKLLDAGLYTAAAALPGAAGPVVNKVKPYLNKLKSLFKAAPTPVTKTPNIINKTSFNLEELGLTSDNIIDIAENTRKRLLTDKFIENNMKTTGRTRKEVIEEVEKHVKEFEAGNLTITKDPNIKFEGIYKGDGELGLNLQPWLIPSVAENKRVTDNVLGTLEHEINHLMSDSKGPYIIVGKDNKLANVPLYDNYPTLKLADDANTPGGIAYQSVAPEQQVRLRKSIRWLEDHADLKMGEEITDEHVKKLGDALKNFGNPRKYPGSEEMVGSGKTGDIRQLLDHLDLRSVLEPGEAAFLSEIPVGSKRWIKTVKEALNKTYGGLTAAAVGGAAYSESRDNEKLSLRYGGYLSRYHKRK